MLLGSGSLKSSNKDRACCYPLFLRFFKRSKIGVRLGLTISGSVNRLKVSLADMYGISSSLVAVLLLISVMKFRAI